MQKIIEESKQILNRILSENVNIMSLQDYLRLAYSRAVTTAPSVWENYPSTYPHLLVIEDGKALGLSNTILAEIVMITAVLFIVSDMKDDILDDEYDPKWTTALLSTKIKLDKSILNEYSNRIFTFAIQVLLDRVTDIRIIKGLIYRIGVGFEGQIAELFELFSYDVITTWKSGNTFSIPGFLLESVSNKKVAGVYHDLGVLLQNITDMKNNPYGNETTGLHSNKSDADIKKMIIALQKKAVNLKGTLKLLGKLPY